MAATAFEFDARSAGTLLIAWLRLVSFFHFVRHLGLLRLQDVLHEQGFHPAYMSRAGIRWGGIVSGRD